MKMQSPVPINRVEEKRLQHRLNIMGWMRSDRYRRKQESWTVKRICDIMQSGRTVAHPGLPGWNSKEHCADMRRASRKDNGTCEVFAQIGMVSVIPAVDFVLCAGTDDHGVLFFDECYQYLYHFEGWDGKARSGGDDGGR